MAMQRSSTKTDDHMKLRGIPAVAKTSDVPEFCGHRNGRLEKKKRRFCGGGSLALDHPGVKIIPWGVQKTICERVNH